MSSCLDFISSYLHIDLAAAHDVQVGISVIGCQLIVAQTCKGTLCVTAKNSSGQTVWYASVKNACPPSTTFPFPYPCEQIANWTFEISIDGHKKVLPAPPVVPTTTSVCVDCQCITRDDTACEDCGYSSINVSQNLGIVEGSSICVEWVIPATVIGSPFKSGKSCIIVGTLAPNAPVSILIPLDANVTKITIDGQVYDAQYLGINP